ncbi:MAG: fatty acid desaturase family protein [Alphaproteobacteria bacterium]|nr:fatty acid desaturase family protein [Alphaproteobacteria bacterium]
MAGNASLGGGGADRGREFRDDLRRRSLPADIVKRLTIIDPARATLSVAETVAATAVFVAFGAYFWTWWAVLPAMVLIASRQQAFFILAHDAAHYRLYKTRWLNDLVGRACGTVIGISMCAYRVVHRLHHNHLYEPQDPDIPIHAGYPRGRAYLARKLAKDTVGLTAYKTYAYFFGAPAPNDQRDALNRPLDDTAPALRSAALNDRWAVAGFHIGMPIIAFATGWGWFYVILWIVPLVTLLQPILRFRAICEHGAVTDLSSPLTAARTNLGPFWLRWLLFPHDVNYHVEHHMYPAVPHYNLAACHREMARRGLLDGAEVRHFFDTAGRVFADPRRPHEAHPA